MFLSIVGWIVVGSIVGFIASKVVNLRGDDPRLGIGVAVGGALVAGVLYSVISGAGMSDWSTRAFMLAAVGAGAGVAIWHLLRSRYASHAPQSNRNSF
jgi:uncharacterized membrane protein YeaQ/YmgE (transglycosylase-associated protein family)